MMHDGMVNERLFYSDGNSHDSYNNKYVFEEFAIRQKYILSISNFHERGVRTTLGNKYFIALESPDRP